MLKSRPERAADGSAARLHSMFRSCTPAAPGVASAALLPRLDEVCIVHPRDLQGGTIRADRTPFAWTSCMRRSGPSQPQAAERSCRALPTSSRQALAADEVAHSACLRAQHHQTRTILNNRTATQACLAADGVALHAVKVGDGGAAQREELPPQQLAPERHRRLRVLAAALRVDLRAAGGESREGAQVAAGGRQTGRTCAVAWVRSVVYAAQPAVLQRRGASMPASVVACNRCATQDEPAIQPLTCCSLAWNMRGLRQPNLR